MKNILKLICLVAMCASSYATNFVPTLVKDKTGIHDESDYIPANTIVKGTLETGIVINSRESTSSNPIPVIISLADKHSLPVDVQNTVKTCVLSGSSAYSSYRVMVRLDLMKCKLQHNKIIEVPVQGYLTDINGEIGLGGYTKVKGTDNIVLNKGYAVKVVFTQGVEI